jgi:hypothetical protein
LSFTGSAAGAAFGALFAWEELPAGVFSLFLVALSPVRARASVPTPRATQQTTHDHLPDARKAFIAHSPFDKIGRRANEVKSKLDRTLTDRAGIVFGLRKGSGESN